MLEDFAEEERMLIDLVEKFVENELMPLEPISLLCSSFNICN